MNILMVAEVSLLNVIGGAERVLREQALGLADRGHTVRVLTRMGEGESARRVMVQEVEEVRYSVDRSHPIAFFLSSIRNAREAAAALHRESPVDVVVAHQSLPAVGLPGWLDSGIPLVAVSLSPAHEEYEIRNQPSHGAAGRLWYWCQSSTRKWVERAVLRRASRVIVLSDFMRRRIIWSHRVRPALIVAIPGGVDTDVFSPTADRRAVRARLGLDEGAFVLFTVRNLECRMGLSALIGAVAHLRAKIPGVQLLLGGSGPLRAELEAQVKTLGLEGNVRCLGFVPEKDLPDHYRAADLFVLPSSHLEGFGLITIEALACGTPVFGTRIGATAEILGKADYCLLSSGTDAESLAGGIWELHRWFVAEPEARIRLAEAGRALVLRDYTWSRHCERVEAVLQQIVSGRQVAHVDG
jgi:glycosyltransferase involved in cell wall biosynthesis